MKASIKLNICSGILICGFLVLGCSRDDSKDENSILTKGGELLSLQYEQCVYSNLTRIQVSKGNPEDVSRLIEALFRLWLADEEGFQHVKSTSFFENFIANNELPNVEDPLSLGDYKLSNLTVVQEPFWIAIVAEGDDQKLFRLAYLYRSRFDDAGSDRKLEHLSYASLGSDFKDALNEPAAPQGN